MAHLSLTPTSKLISSGFVWLLWIVLGFSTSHTHADTGLTVPQRVTLSPNWGTQELSISWLGGGAATFDLIILRTEFNETVFYETVSPTVNKVSGLHQWTWTSVNPLECTSLSVKIRSRDGHTTSEWSQTETLQGNDHPNSEQSVKVFPQDKVLPVGANITFCCIMDEGMVLDKIKYDGNITSVTRLSRRTYSTTVFNLVASRQSGSNMLCLPEDREKLYGAVVFVGYPPLPIDFKCETHDLRSAVCQWGKGRDTHLYGSKRGTRYFVNNRDCSEVNKDVGQKEATCTLDTWEGNWTLVAKNLLGQYSLTDTAELSHRVCPVAPDLLSVVADAWNASLSWHWKYDSYSSLALVCQVEITATEDEKLIKRVFSGMGLRSVFLSDLYPDEHYSVKVRCGAQQNFWKWGNWSKVSSFKTKTYVPDTPDAWIWLNTDNTGKVVWKPLTRRQSHSKLTQYEVFLWSPEENRALAPAVTLPPNNWSMPVNLTEIAFFSNNGSVVAKVTARNDAGSSPSARVHLTSVEPLAAPRIVYTDQGFPLFWENNANATCGYVVEWLDAFCPQDCPVEWIKLPAGTTNVSIESATFQPGVRYNLSLYSCSSDARELLKRWQGYTQELVPSVALTLSASQQNADILLTWKEIPLVNRRGFLLGYNIYNSTGYQFKLLENVSDPETMSYTAKDFAKGFTKGTFKFTVKAYTAAGENTGTTATVTIEPYTDWLILEILTSLGLVTLLLAIVTFTCYKKRKWVKKAFYPDIPEPKLPSDWPRTRGPLDVKPSPHSMVCVVETPEYDCIKEMLVAIPEEDEDDAGQGIGDESVDTDEPTSLRYYNQMVDERPIRPRFPDSSASSISSMSSAHTDVTYTGIQTSGSSLVLQLDPQGSSECHQPQLDRSVSYGGGGYRPQMQPRAPSDDMGLPSPESFLEPQAACSGGYKPQGSWQLDSPVDAAEMGSLAPSLGSPTSVASTQFLLPDGEENTGEKRQLSSSAASWLTNLLSSTKP